MQPRRVVGYVRVSTDQQADSGAGLAAQRAAILAEVERRGWRLVEMAEDAGVSGKDLKRPGVQAALDALGEGRADTLVVAKLDRLSRSLQDFSGLMATAQTQRWALVALDANVDTSTPAGETLISMLAVFSQFERRLISQRTKDALAAKRAEGVSSAAPDDSPMKSGGGSHASTPRAKPSRRSLRPSTTTECPPPRAGSVGGLPRSGPS